MRRTLSAILILAILLSGCSSSVPIATSPVQTEPAAETTQPEQSAAVTNAPTEETVDSAEAAFQRALTELRAETERLGEPEYDDLDEGHLHRYLNDSIYAQLTSQFQGKDYFIEDISMQYLSQEYIDELEFNSKKNVYFGYNLEDLDKHFGGNRYVFTLGENNETVVVPFEGYDDTYERVIRNVAVGTGVILTCVTVSVLSAEAAPAVCVIFAASAKSGTIMALSSGTIGGIIGGLVEGVQTQDFDKAIKAAALAGSEGFKCGSITGSLIGGATETIFLKEATAGGLSMNEAAVIQQLGQYPLDVIQEFSSLEQFNIAQEAGLTPSMINGKAALVRQIDWSQTDTAGNSNLARVLNRQSPLDQNGIPYELHHIGQRSDSTLAVLTKSEHMQGGNNKIWHIFGNPGIDHGSAWESQRYDFWIDLAGQQLSPLFAALG